MVLLRKFLLLFGRSPVPFIPLFLFCFALALVFVSCSFGFSVSSVWDNLISFFLRLLDSGGCSRTYLVQLLYCVLLFARIHAAFNVTLGFGEDVIAHNFHVSHGYS
jgi:hypothetical protein